MKDHLEAIGLKKSYHDKKVVDDVSISLKKGEIVGLLGPNGAGKTTTFSLILGLIRQDSGRIFLDGEEITNLSMYLRARKGLCLLPQEPSAFRRLNVADNLLSVKEISRDFSKGGGMVIWKTSWMSLVWINWLRPRPTRFPAEREDALKLPVPSS